jgi:hypothetical protein
MDPYWLKKTVECRDTCTEKPIRNYTPETTDSNDAVVPAVTKFTDD